MTEGKKKRDVVIEVIIALLFYTFAAVALTWPAIIHLDEILLGGGELGG